MPATLQIIKNSDLYNSLPDSLSFKNSEALHRRAPAISSPSASGALLRPLPPLKDVALVSLQGFQRGRDIAFMLHLSRNSQIRHQKRAAQLGDQFLKRIRLRAKLIAFFTIEAGRCPVQ